MNHLRRGIYCAVGVCAFIALTDLLLAPIYDRGVGQAWISHLNGLSTLLAFPGTVAAAIVGVRTGDHLSGAAWSAILVAAFVFYAFGVTTASALWAWLTRRRRALKAPDAPIAPTPAAPLISRRRLIRAGVGAAVVGGVGYPLMVATRRYEVTRRTFPVRGLPASLDGLRIVQVTDVHHGPWMPIGHVRGVVETVNALDPDLVLLTGDYVHRSSIYIDPVVTALSQLRAKIGIVGVLGNHDWWEGAPATQRAFARVGIPLIDNGRRFVTPDRTMEADAKEGLCLAGVGDYWEDAIRFDDALGGVPDEMPRLLLSHNPDVAEDATFRRFAPRVDLMLSGHTHGGQIYVPGFGTPVVPSRYGQKYARGLVQGPVCPVYVNRGTGHSVLPVRIGIRPEVAVIELRKA